MDVYYERVETRLKDLQNGDCFKLENEDTVFIRLYSQGAETIGVFNTYTNRIQDIGAVAKVIPLKVKLVVL